MINPFAVFNAGVLIIDALLPYVRTAPGGKVCSACG